MPVYRSLGFLFIFVFACEAYENASPLQSQELLDTLPSVEISLDPPAVPFPEVQRELDQQETKREQLEADGMQRLRAAFTTARLDAKKRIDVIAKRACHVTLPEAPNGLVFLQTRSTQVREVPLSSVNVHVDVPETEVSAEVESLIASFAQHRSEEESKMIEEAVTGMTGITDIVCDRLEAELKSQLEDATGANYSLRSAGPVSAASGGATGFLEASAVVRPVQGIVKVVPSKDYPTVASLVDAAERRRDMTAGLLAWRAFHLQLALFKEENRIVKEALDEACGGRRSVRSS